MKGDCLELMKTIPDKSVDMVLTDPPYGTTACKWDSVIPFDKMWSELNRITINTSAILLFGIEPFSSFLRLSNIDAFKYDWVWDKNCGTDFGNANKKPLYSMEIVSVFYRRQPKYSPQGIAPYNKTTKRGSTSETHGATGFRSKEYKQKFTNYPRQILPFSKPGKRMHPTQKPVPLLEYLIKTYTTEGETVLDFTMGSGSTGAACKNLNRNFIGIERDEKYFEIARARIENA